MLFNSLYYTQMYLDTYPDGEFASQDRDIHTILVEECQKQLDGMGLAEADTPFLRDFEKGRILVSHGHSEEGRRFCQRAIDALPGFPPPRNNLALSYVADGNLEKALEQFQAILTDHPKNIHTSANIVQMLIRTGRREEAEPLLAELRQAIPDESDHWYKIMETVAMAGEDEAVLEIYDRVKKNLDKDHITPYMHHLAAAAYARTGNEKRAQKLWRKVRREMDLDVVQGNLLDLMMPIDMRNGAMVFLHRSAFRAKVGGGSGPLAGASRTARG